MATGDIVLGDNQYGKAEVRLVRLVRDAHPQDPGRHEITDLTVTTQLRGDFVACHTEGDNSQVVATDTQKNTVYALARTHGVTSPEAFLTTLGRHFVDSYPWVDGGRWAAELHAWDRIAVDGQPHGHAFVRTGRATRRAVVQIHEGRTHVLAGFADCTVLKSTGSEFHGFPRDRFTTLAETDDRILATSITAWWRYGDLGADTEDADPEGADGAGVVDFDATYAAVQALMLETFASLHSQALQQTMFAMGRAVLEAFPEIAECRFSMPNKHHFLVDLTPFDLDNPGEVFYAADRPYGLIEAAVQREGDAPVPAAWASVPGFC